MSWCLNPVAVTSGDDQDHPAAEGTMVLVLSAVVPWAFRNTKAFQGIDQEVGGCQVQLGKSPGSILPHPSDNKDRVNKLCTNIWVQKGVDGIYYYNMVGYRFHGYTIIRIGVLARSATPIMGTLLRSG